MKDFMDVYIRQSLKNWSTDQHPQANGRARLLLVAAAIQRDRPIVKTLKAQVKGLRISRRSPIDQAMLIYNLPWLLVAHISFSPIRSVT